MRCPVWQKMKQQEKDRLLLRGHKINIQKTARQICALSAWTRRHRQALRTETGSGVNAQGNKASSGCSIVYIGVYARIVPGTYGDLAIVAVLCAA